jgi:tRNA U34 5-carboxymethylaminomethyl modifying enzyme MnmG/GidA
MVRELDALGGVMGLVTDRAGIQFKMLNRGRGPAVWSPRAQCDKALYSAEMLKLLDGVSGLESWRAWPARARARRARQPASSWTEDDSWARARW